MADAAEISARPRRSALYMPGANPRALDKGRTLAADVLIASDGPRLQSDTPTMFMGARGGIAFDLIVDPRQTTVFTPKAGRASRPWTT